MLVALGGGSNFQSEGGVLVIRGVWNNPGPLKLKKFLSLLLPQENFNT